jgi:Pyruvate/2-oxoacid:ferredoxin oxidoreductase delta subunit
MTYDLNDPATRKLYDSYGEGEKQDFETAYLYMKYLYEFVSIILQGFGAPPNPELESMDPAIIEKLNAKRDVILGGFGNKETSMYYSKVIRLENAEQLVTQEVDLHLAVPETIVPFKLARNVILNHPGAIAVGTCPCRLTNPESTCMQEPMEACLFLGDPHASFIAEHNPRFRKIEQKEAVTILEDCHKRGFVQCAYFKKDMGNRLYAICNCCSCCCGGIKTTNLFTSGISPVNNLAPSGYVARVSDDCIACGDCVESCQFNAIVLRDDEDIAEISVEKCMGCGVCESRCPSDAITMEVDASKCGILDLEAMKAS